jgi:hypothetical protein
MGETTRDDIRHMSPREIMRDNLSVDPHVAGRQLLGELLLFT